MGNGSKQLERRIQMETGSGKTLARGIALVFGPPTHG